MTRDGRGAVGFLRALVVDDEPAMRRFLAEVLRGEGWEVCEAETAERAFEMMRARRWSLVFCDVVLGGANGISVLRRFMEEQPGAQVVLMSGNVSGEDALDATALGAYDYLMKPFGVEQVRGVSDAARMRAARREDDTGAAPPAAPDITLVGRSPAFVEAMKLVGRAAPTDLPVFITGESGTGKEVVARAVHRRSRRAEGPFVAVNCGALPAELIESELFGHVRGSFTGAERDRPGLFEEAEGGTVFLDEVTETSPAFQVKLLRALQDGEIRRVGSNRTLHVDVRVIAATNRDPGGEVRRGRFRQDLLYRLNALSIHLPPLRERREDILPLIRHFAARARAQGAPPLAFSPDALRLLEDYDWPGNIRELENTVLRAAALCDHVARPTDLPEAVRIGQAGGGAGEDEEIFDPPGGKGWLTLTEVERRYVARVLSHTRGNKQAAARLLAVDRNTLKRMIGRHNLNA
ncbi:MAG: sigma-54 dependent transcriptional regulator [Acidobacteriota bacterium]|nr:sigma-54 dependent transcriptional regulator [Acidobacteriota bacterium]